MSAVNTTPVGMAVPAVPPDIAAIMPQIAVIGP